MWNRLKATENGGDGGAPAGGAPGLPAVRIPDKGADRPQRRLRWLARYRLVAGEAVTTAIAVSIGPLLGLLPIAYLFWYDKLRRRIDEEASNIAGLGPFMHEVGAKKLTFTGPFRVRNIMVEIDIEAQPTAYRERERALGQGGRLVESGGADYEKRALFGLDRLAGGCLKRGYRVFISLLALLAGILVFSIVTISIGELTQLTMGLFIIGVISFLLYAATTFTERNIRWSTWFESDGTAYFLDNLMWR